MKSKRTIATSISYRVRQTVHERDRGCILCGRNYYLEVAHYIPRSRGGKGIEENLVLLCRECHRKFDQSIQRKEIASLVESYLKSHYKDWDNQKLIYKKREQYE